MVLVASNVQMYITIDGFTETVGVFSFTDPVFRAMLDVGVKNDLKMSILFLEY